MKLFKRNQKKRQVNLPKTEFETTDITDEPVSISLHSEITRFDGLKDDKEIVSNQGQFPMQNANIILEKTGSEEGKMVKGDKQFDKSDLAIELEANLAIATKPLVDKLLPFQNSFYDSTCGENELIFINNRRELIQLYVDINLANNLVWLSTEFGYRSKEIDESYVMLCDSITNRINDIMSSNNIVLQNKLPK